MTSIDQNALRTLIDIAKSEDLGTGDLSSALLENSSEQVRFRLLAKMPGVFAGVRVAEHVLHAYDGSLEIDWTSAGSDGAVLDDNETELATITGPLGSILSAERVFLNFLQRLSGIATVTREFVDAVADTEAAILDTRKTTPGWRALEKYAVRCGGGQNHRSGLFDAVLIKDNHLAGIEPGRLASALFEMLNRLSEGEVKPSFVEVEVDSLLQLGELLKVVGIDIILLDNFSDRQLREAVAMRDSFGLREKVLLEASGGVTLKTVRAIALAGVDRISVGAITHSAPALDLSLERILC